MLSPDTLSVPVMVGGSANSVLVAVLLGLCLVVVLAAAAVVDRAAADRRSKSPDATARPGSYDPTRGGE